MMLCTNDGTLSLGLIIKTTYVSIYECSRSYSPISIQAFQFQVNWFVWLIDEIGDGINGVIIRCPFNFKVLKKFDHQNQDALFSHSSPDAHSRAKSEGQTQVGMEALIVWKQIQKTCLNDVT